MVKKCNRFVSGCYFAKPQLIKFEENKLISDEDLINLFMGLTRLIKHSTEVELESKYLGRIKYLERKLREIK